MRITVFDCAGDERELFARRAEAQGVDLKLVNEPISAGNARLSCGSRCISVSHRAPLCEFVLRELKTGGVELVTTRSIGTDHVDLSAADKLGIRVESIAYSPDGVADYAVMLILMALRNAKGMLGRAETGDFSLDCARSPDLREMTVGVVGAGRIGQGVIARLRAFGCRISAYGNANAGETLRASFDEWIGQCDVLTFHLPLTARTRHILNGRNMRQVKDGAYIVNTGRGGLIETEALLTALKAGKLRGAALDVVEGEEDIFYGGHRGERIEKGVFSELCKMSNVIITPHAAFYTRRALIETVENTILKCLEYEGSKKWTG